jgi:predicted PolB exonuclease-like 3'-5' exonuclease
MYIQAILAINIAKIPELERIKELFPFSGTAQIAPR